MPKGTWGERQEIEQHSAVIFDARVHLEATLPLSLSTLQTCYAHKHSYSCRAPGHVTTECSMQPCSAPGGLTGAVQLQGGDIAAAQASRCQGRMQRCLLRRAVRGREAAGPPILVDGAAEEECQGGRRALDLVSPRSLHTRLWGMEGEQGCSKGFASDIPGKG